MLTLALILTAILGLATGYPSLFLFSLAALLLPLLLPLLSIVIFLVIAVGVVLWACNR